MSKNLTQHLTQNIKAPCLSNRLTSSNSATRLQNATTQFLRKSQNSGLVLPTQKQQQQQQQQQHIISMNQSNKDYESNTYYSQQQQNNPSRQIMDTFLNNSNNSHNNSGSSGRINNEVITQAKQQNVQCSISSTVNNGKQNQWHSSKRQLFLQNFLNDSNKENQYYGMNDPNIVQQNTYHHESVDIFGDCSVITPANLNNKQSVKQHSRQPSQNINRLVEHQFAEFKSPMDLQDNDDNEVNIDGGDEPGEFVFTQSKSPLTQTTNIHGGLNIDTTTNHPLLYTQTQTDICPQQQQTLTISLSNANLLLQQSQVLNGLMEAVDNSSTSQFTDTCMMDATAFKTQNPGGGVLGMNDFDLYNHNPHHQPQQNIYTYFHGGNGADQGVCEYGSVVSNNNNNYKTNGNNIMQESNNTKHYKSNSTISTAYDNQNNQEQSSKFTKSQGNQQQQQQHFQYGSDNEIENVLIGSIRPSKQEQIKQEEQKSQQQLLLKSSQQQQYISTHDVPKKEQCQNISQDQQQVNTNTNSTLGIDKLEQNQYKQQQSILLTKSQQFKQSVDLTQKKIDTHANPNIKDMFDCKRNECIERDQIMSDQTAKIEEMEKQIADLQLKLMHKKGKIAIMKLERQYTKKREKQMDILLQHDHNDTHHNTNNSTTAYQSNSSSNGQDGGQNIKKKGKFLLRGGSKNKKSTFGSQSNSQIDLQDAAKGFKASMIEHQNSYDSKLEEQEIQDDLNGFDDDVDTYEKRDRHSHYKKMNLRTESNGRLSTSNDPQYHQQHQDSSSTSHQQHQNKESGGFNSVASAIQNMKVSKKAGIPLGPLNSTQQQQFNNKVAGNNPLLSTRNLHQPTLSNQLPTTSHKQQLYSARNNSGSESVRGSQQQQNMMRQSQNRQSSQSRVNGSVDMFNIGNRSQRDHHNNSGIGSGNFNPQYYGTTSNINNNLDQFEQYDDNCSSMIEMDSPTRATTYQQQNPTLYGSQQNFNQPLSSMRQSYQQQQQNSNFIQQSNANFNPLLYQQQYQQQQMQMQQLMSGNNMNQDPQTVYFEDLDVFDEFEKKFKDFLKSTPYIEQILQTSKEYRMIIESLNILARFNDELKRIVTMTSQLAEEGKKLFISKQKGQQIIQKNRELRVQIKSLLKDQGTGGGTSSTLSGSMSGGFGALKQGEKNNNTKRELIKQRNYLMQENDSLTFKFKKLFLF